MRNMFTWLAVPAIIVALAGVLWLTGVLSMSNAESERHRKSPNRVPPPGAAKATFGGGCFWCTEAVFQKLKGIYTVTSGYSGGHVKNPTYEQVCSKTTGHAEVIQIEYDPREVAFADLLEVFWKTHDPTTLNRQGHDHGPQYRSVVFYHDAEQKETAAQLKNKLDESGVFDGPIVTEIAPFTEFYPAEGYHQNYYLSNPGQGYCVAIIGPKLAKFDKVFKSKIKTP